MIEINNISKSFLDKLLFKNLNLTIYDGEKIGIVGENGTGKSTLLNLIAKNLEVDSGHIHLTSKISYVSQITNNVTNQLREIIRNNLQNPTFLKLFSDFNLNTQILSCDNFDNLSGGEITKIFIINSLISDCDTILLDEPTNNLDQKSIEILIEKLDNFKGTIVTVSHDRYFLNNVVNKIIELENGHVNEYYGNYDDYARQKQEKLISQKKIYDNQEKLETKLNKQINEIKQKAQKLEKNNHRDGSSDRRCKGFKGGMSNKIAKLSNAAKNKINRLNQLKEDFIDRPYESGEIYYKINECDYTPKLLLKIENLNKSFGNNVIFNNANFIVEGGQKIALLGDNASGKTTLFKILLGQESFEGTLYKSPALKIAYLSQNILDLKSDKTVMEFASQFDSFYKTKFLTNLANMNMTKQTFNRKISTLSQGERLKIKLNEIILSDYNLLILDEPTNHLDILNKIFLEDVLKNYQGTIILVSHDKTFCNNVCNKFLKIENKTIILQNK